MLKYNISIDLLQGKNQKKAQISNEIKNSCTRSRIRIVLMILYSLYQLTQATWGFSGHKACIEERRSKTLSK